ncbi:hypothetical protein F5X96DRAFT_662541 [Biscogniauxia mediterranea]|nr:hypothetical protein F5X96DRAFT_662541 [Biscogniauxia mediterranea]
MFVPLNPQPPLPRLEASLLYLSYLREMGATNVGAWCTWDTSNLSEFFGLFLFLSLFPQSDLYCMAINIIGCKVCKYTTVLPRRCITSDMYWPWECATLYVLGMEGIKGVASPGARRSQTRYVQKIKIRPVLNDDPLVQSRPILLTVGAWEARVLEPISIASPSPPFHESRTPPNAGKGGPRGRKKKRKKH